MARRIYIVAADTVIDASVIAAAASVNCPEIIKGIPPKLAGIIEEGDLPTAYEEPVQPNSDPEIAHWAQVTGFNVAALKPLSVERNYKGELYTFDCYVTETVKDQYQAGDIVIDDFVLVVFVDDRKDQPLAISKIFKTW